MIVEMASKYGCYWDKILAKMREQHKNAVCTHVHKGDQLRNRFSTLRKQDSVIYRKIQVPEFVPPEGHDQVTVRRLNEEHSKKYILAEIRQIECRKKLERIKKKKDSLASSDKNQTNIEIKKNLSAATRKRKRIRNRRTKHWERASLIETSRAKQQLVNNYLSLSYLRESMKLERKLVNFITGGNIVDEADPLEEKLLKNLRTDMEGILKLSPTEEISESENSDIYADYSDDDVDSTDEEKEKEIEDESEKEKEIEDERGSDRVNDDECDM